MTTFVGAGTVGSAISGNPTPPGLPTSWAAGDIHICTIVSGDNVQSTMSVGWTSLFDTTNGVTFRRAIFWRRAVAGDAAPTITHAAGSSILARIVGFRGCVSSGSPINANAEQVNASSVTITAPTVTPANNEATIFIGALTNTDTSTALSSSGYSGTNPTLSEIADSEFGLGSTEVTCCIAWGLSNGTATGARTATCAAAGANIGTLLSLIDPPAGISSGTPTWDYGHPPLVRI